MIVRSNLILTLFLLVIPGACKKTGDGEYQVQVPKITTQTETLRTPRVEVKKETTTVVTPKIKVKKPPPQTM